MLQVCTKAMGKQFFQRRFQLLLGLIILTLLLSPLLGDLMGMRFLLNLFFTGILISASFAASDRKSQPIIASLLALPMLASFWTSLLFPWPGLMVVELCSGVLFFCYIILVVLAYVLRSRYVTQEVISGALVVYLLLGLLWTFLFTLVEHLNPGSFSFANTLGAEKRFSFIYYSYVTLTTLGYGDITPLTQMSTALAVLEAIIGQIYLTVLIARLVGLHISHNPKGEK
ncbi:MAG: hypothetical protein BA871_14625 [Desulfuromonadales bacterium C00003096]|jgi:voltage-gated potassium channel Kch|nr:MAG: hypothetical protein BA871_14625 [Desulfuromonadales bacterium C00003096]